MKNKTLKSLLSVLLAITLIIPFIPAVKADATKWTEYEAYCDIFSDETDALRSLCTHYQDFINATSYNDDFESIEAKDLEVYMFIGDTKSVKMPMKDKKYKVSKLCKGTFTYDTTDSSVASVSENGTITANAAGTAIIYTTYDDKKLGYFTVQVPVRVFDDKETLKKAYAVGRMSEITYYIPDLVVGEKQLVEFFYHSDRHTCPGHKGYGPQEIKSLSVKSKDKDIVSVSKKSGNYYITGKKKGKTTVYLVFKDIYGYSYKTFAEVYVN